MMICLTFGTSFSIAKTLRMRNKQRQVIALCGLAVLFLFTLVCFDYGASILMMQGLLAPIMLAAIR
jgi:hypothetical protein